MSGAAFGALRESKRAGRKLVAIVAWDYPIARIADRVGVDIVSVGDSVGVNLWGHASESEVGLAEMLVVCKAVRRGVRRALVSCDVPASVMAMGMEETVRAADRLAREGGADMVKIHGDADTVRAITAAGVPVFAEFHGRRPVAELVDEAKRLENAGAVLLDFRHSGAEAGAAVAEAVTIPVIGGLGGGPWLDGRVRLAHAAIGYGAEWLDSDAETYLNTAKLALEALRACADDVRAGRPLKGQRPG